MRWAFATWIILSACTPRGVAGEGSAQKEPLAAPAEPRQERPSAPALQAKPSVAEKPAIDVTRYPWLDGTAEGVPAPVDTLESRFPTEPGFSRVPLAPESFGAFLRTLPLAAKGSAVLSYRGSIVREPDHPNVAAVVAIDVGRRDLQQCADAVIRMHAEWSWSRGKRDQAYRAASGTKLSFAGYLAGDRIKVDGNRIFLERIAKPIEATHAAFRTWLDDVFGWANTGALSRDGERVGIETLRPGDFFVLTGAPYGHTVLVLDMAKDEKGRRAVLLGQSFVPAQNFHVVRKSPESAWFVIDEARGVIETPFWEPFPFDSLRRFSD